MFLNIAILLDTSNTIDYHNHDVCRFFFIRLYIEYVGIYETDGFSNFSS